MTREEMMALIGNRLGFERRGEAARRRLAEARLARPPIHLLPAIACGGGAECVAGFVERVRAHGSDVLELSNIAELPSRIATYLATGGFDLRLAAGCDRRLLDLKWAAAPLELQHGCAVPCRVALSHAFAGVAETGTLVLLSGPDNPGLLAFLPEIHLVAIARESVVASYEEALARVRLASSGTRQLPRALNLVSGASRTGDIGGRIVMGAHGPRRLAVFLYG
ncbi:MAG: lactate utilization protein [Hyphomicrobium sp.]|jgi:L-lactate dehydrogenase complex protein LldG